jgi:hypothetical protein
MYTRKELVVDYDQSLNIECTSCQLISNEIIETNCGHVYCNHCYRNMQHPIICIQCHQLITSTSYPKLVSRFINKLLIKCEICDNVFPFGEKNNHEKNCDILICVCGDKIPKKTYEEHIKVCVLNGQEFDNKIIIEQLKQFNKENQILKEIIVKMQNQITRYVLEDRQYNENDDKFMRQFNNNLANQAEKQMFNNILRKYLNKGIRNAQNQEIYFKLAISPLILDHDIYNNSYHLYGHMNINSEHVIPKYQSSVECLSLLNGFDDYFIIIDKSVLKCLCNQGYFDAKKISNICSDGNDNKYIHVDIWFN